MSPAITTPERQSAWSSAVPVASSVFVREGEAWSEISVQDGGACRVRLGGAFRPPWMTSLCRGLSDRRISIDQLHGKRAHDGSWIAELHLVALEGASDPRGIPYVRLASDAPQACTAAPLGLKLDAYELAASPDYGGTLFLRVEAQDMLGLLSSLCAALSSLSLYPTEVHVETREGRAYDCLWLTGAGAEAPSVDAHEALERLLQQCLMAR